MKKVQRTYVGFYLDPECEVFACGSVVDTQLGAEGTRALSALRLALESPMALKLRNSGLEWVCAEVKEWNADHGWRITREEYEAERSKDNEPV